jgi:uncharacterized protein (TIGR01777 family)
MKIAIAGYSGFIGKQFVLDRTEDQMVLLPRKLLYGGISAIAEAIEGAELVVNLAGSPIIRRWTPKNKRIIKESRFGVNSRLVEAINSLRKKPDQFITASAIGFYDTTGIHTEADHRPADNYLASVVKQWEKPLEKLHHTVAPTFLRIGVVMGRDGGVLPIMLMSSRLGLLPVMGSGKQMFSFIHLGDVIGAMRWIISGKRQGVYNLCAPRPVDNVTFTRALAKERGVKLLFRIPVFVLKAGLGEAHIMLTEGAEVRPEKLIQEGYTFSFPDIDVTIQNLLQKN